MSPNDEIRLLARGIRTLKDQRDATLSELSDKDPYTKLEYIFDLLSRYDNLVCCLLTSVWDEIGDRPEDEGAKSDEKR